MLAAGHPQTQQILQEALAKEHECSGYLGLLLYFQKTVEYWERICYIVLENSERETGDSSQAKIQSPSGGKTPFILMILHSCENLGL